MPKNKDSLIRYRIINKCLVEKTFVTLKELKDACERALDIYPISERTIEADISAMRYDEGLGYKAPIKLDRTRRAYYYYDPNYSIDNMPLNEEEIGSLIFAARLLEQYKDIEIFNTFIGSVQKLVDAINVYRLTEEDVSRSFIEFEKSDITVGSEHLEALIGALKNRDVIKIEYKSFITKKITISIVHPYHLKEYRNRWYLICFNPKYSGIRTYALDRIVKITIDNKIKFIDTGFIAREYYKNVIGISVSNRKPIDIHIAFTELQAQYVITQPLHSSQELVSKTKNRYVFRYFLIPNFEFVAQILGWGEEVEIMKPEKLRKMLSDKLLNISMKYSTKE